MKSPECRTDCPDEATRTLDGGSIVDTLAQGTVFAGRYQVIEELGRGGMGRVFRVFDKTLQEEVALKFIRPEIAAQKRTLERFSHELKTARKIVHKNIGRVFEIEERDGNYFISMEYVRGEDLKSLLLRAGPLSLGKSLRIAAQICSGLSEAHALGIVHRDLKSRNIMIDENGNARIMDFGIALTPEMSNGAATAGIVGSPESMSPEQAAGRPVDPRSDIYSLGVVLYQMVTGELPFKGDASSAILLKHKTMPAPDPRAVNPQIPESFSRLILKCLEKDPARRFQKVRDILPELDRIGQDHGLTGGLDGDSASALRSGTRSGPSRIIRKKIVVPVFAVSAVVMIAAGFAAYRLFFRPSPPLQDSRWKTSIAVLPIQTPPDLESLRESLSGDIISELSRTLTDVRITPSHSMWLYKDTLKPLKQIGDELRAAYLLKLILHHAGPFYKASAELSEVRSNAVFESWNEEYTAISDIQEKLPLALSDRLKLSLPVPGGKTIPQQAYLAYLNGWNAEKRYRNFVNPQDFEIALSQYRMALKGSPDYAKAYVGTGNIHQLRFFSDHGNRDPEDFYQMRKAYEKAYEIDPHLAEANAGLAWTFFFKEDLTNAYKFYQEALRLAPNNPEALFNFASFLRDIGLFDQAIPLFERACEIDLVWMEYVNQLARCRMLKGDFEGAMKDTLNGLSKEPKNEELRLLRARLLIMTGKIDEAAAIVEAVEKTSPDNPWILRLRALIFAVQGKKAAALDLLRGCDPILYSACLSLVYAAVGMKDEAVANIQAVVSHGFERIGSYLYTYGYLKTCPFYKGLQNDPRFQIILSNSEREHQINLRLYGGKKYL